MLALFQTASGTWHIPSILMATSWILGTVLAGVFMFANLRVNQKERLKSYEKEQQNIATLKAAQVEIAGLKEKTKPVPLKTRLISCLENIDKRTIPALRAGNTSFVVGLLPYQLIELQKLAAEDRSSKFIELSAPTTTSFRKSGTINRVEFKLKPALLK